MEGQTQQQAAGHLGWPLGTLQSRLARGRHRLRSRLIRRGLAPSAGLLASLISAEATWASVPTALGISTTQAAMRFTTGKSASAGAVSASVAALTEGVMKTMSLQTFKAIAAAVVASTITAAGVGVWAQQASRTEPSAAFSLAAVPVLAPVGAEEAPHSGAAAEQAAGGESNAFAPDKKTRRRTVESMRLDAGGQSNASAPDKTNTSLKYGDGKADGKRSLGGSGEMIEFSVPADGLKVTGIRIHGSLYGQTPKESFLIYFLNHDLTRILHTEMAPYSLFERGPERWVDVTFEHPVDVSHERPVAALTADHSDAIVSAMVKTDIALREAQANLDVVQKDDPASKEITAMRNKIAALEEKKRTWAELNQILGLEKNKVKNAGTFWVALDFRATQTKGVYVSFDTSTKGEHSRMGLPGTETSAVNFGGDWLIEAKLAPR